MRKPESHRSDSNRLRYCGTALQPDMSKMPVIDAVQAHLTRPTDDILSAHPSRSTPSSRTTARSSSSSSASSPPLLRLNIRLHNPIPMHIILVSPPPERTSPSTGFGRHVAGWTLPWIVELLYLCLTAACVRWRLSWRWLSGHLLWVDGSVGVVVSVVV